MSCLEYTQLSRRDFMVGSLQSAAGLLFGQAIMPLPQHLPRLRLANPHTGPRGDTLVCVFLRGGADGLNIVVPHGDEGYYAQRPTLALPRPDTFGTTQRVLDLDGFFGLHPALQPLHALYGRRCITAIEEQLQAGRKRIVSFFPLVNVRELGAEHWQESDPEGLSFRNINTPEEYFQLRGEPVSLGLSSKEHQRVSG